MIDDAVQTVQYSAFTVCIFTPSVRLVEWTMSTAA
jgi:hypothetical protein